MLSASHRVLRVGGRTAFHTIEPAAGLTGAARRRARSVGPPAVAVRTTYQSLLRSAGFTEIDAVDLTAEYHATQLRFVDATRRHERALRDSLGDESVDDGIRRRRHTIAAIEQGLLVRTMYTATR